MFGWFGLGGDHKTYTPGELRDLMREQKGAVILVDVREHNEWAGGRIPGAVHAPLSRFASMIADIPKDKKLVFYCASGMRSRTALGHAKKMGWQADGHLGGGISEWRRHEMPLTR
ncbi:rhodanese-like domain-containing protein [Rhodoblastus acidophilus]|uniref:Rhodanese-like domain-containing protein n=1 Tax=Candidatus Rhodoblastus alkanivorans TaxID=2954117 RepID=A0ABS9Z7T8_9HYPH|nr:rhodanese-like domain-containing protein [Candidatus Rhodoblastus alkanivorans]MCI4679631.1 rhodanese-like domain-containing protein [Candidatus Rhodoblastus alkanivorans]MCI4683667.1 rhodanese-like domain-containing protein [Candidatus Rhodoblastus alkanivorans]MDI4640984.1 rhodanese-like domain-containing protein [Rhodoblastus acidophilus]